MKKYIQNKIIAILKLFSSKNIMIIMGEKGYGHSYGWKDRNLFFKKNSFLTKK